jgi:hypothetical protein
MTNIILLSLRPVNLKSLVMLKRFITLCFFVAIILLVPYYFSVLMFSEDELVHQPAPAIWSVGLFMIILLGICITLLGVAYNYVVHGR